MARDCARSHVLEPEAFIERNQVVMGKEGQLFRRLGIFDSCNVGLHENRAEAHFLKLRCNGHGMDTNGSSLVLVPERFFGIIETWKG